MKLAGEAREALRGQGADLTGGLWGHPGQPMDALSRATRVALTRDNYNS